MNQQRERDRLRAVSKSSVLYVVDPVICEKSCSKMYFLNGKIARESL